jgi:hypothetical protein
MTVPLIVLALLAAGDVDLGDKSERIQELVFAGRYAEAEPIVRECLEKGPREIYFLSQLDIVLNGQGRHADADRVRDRIRTIWEEDYRAGWIAKGSPVAQATWARVIVPARDYNVVGAEYFVPEGLGANEPRIVSFFKVIALPRAGGAGGRVFKLEMSRLVEEYHVLREVLGRGGRQVIPYGKDKPDIRRLVKEAVAFLDGEKK